MIGLLVRGFLAFWLTCQSPSQLRAADIQVQEIQAGRPNVIFVAGPIEPGDDVNFYRIAKQAKTATVVLDSPGGSVDVGLSIGAEIAIRGYATLVLDGHQCFSICAVIWVAGARRYMAPDAAIGVHAAYKVHGGASGKGQTLESGVANADIGAFLNQIGLSRQAIRYFTTAPPDGLLPITPAIAQRLDIDVFIQDGYEVSPPSERPTPRRLMRQTADYLAMSIHCDSLFGVEPAFLKRQGDATLRRGHEIFGGATFADLVGEYSSSVKDQIQRDGFVRWCVMAEQNLRLDGLPTGINGPSYDCAKASNTTERAICSSSDLWALDRAMSSLYFFYRRNTNSKVSKEFLDSQREWLRRRDNCGSSTQCLVQRYTSRLLEFGA